MITAHGVVTTPAFIPVGTRGAVKAMTHRDLQDVGAQLVLANTYHLYLRPGDGLIARCGGVHRFIGWPGPILTDSGGYQVFSLRSTRTLDEQGVRFRSHLDGSKHLLTPEKATEIQSGLGSDIAMALDECVTYPASVDEVRVAMERTVRWARRARDRFLSLKAVSRGAGGPCRDEPRSGAVWDCPRRRASRAARHERAGDDGGGVRRVCDRRLERG